MVFLEKRNLSLNRHILIVSFKIFLFLRGIVINIAYYILNDLSLDIGIIDIYHLLHLLHHRRRRCHRYHRQIPNNKNNVYKNQYKKRRIKYNNLEQEKKYKIKK